MDFLKVFDYLPDLDCFIVNPKFQDIVTRLGLAEWTPVVWICRYLILDNDYGEHVFDNWDERDALVKLAKEKGISLEKVASPEDSYYTELIGPNALYALIVVPHWFKSHSPNCIQC